MTRSEPAPDKPEGPLQQHVTEGTLRMLGDAIDRLQGDSEYIARSLTDMLLTMRPVTKNRHTEAETRLLIELDAFTPEEWAETVASVDRGSLQLGATEGWLMNFLDTKSLERVTGFLGWNEEAVRAAVAEGRLFAIEVSGRLRFPSWQFDLASPGKLLPGLTEVIKAVTTRWGWQSVAGFMNTPQEDLVAEGRKTPVAWLRDGGDVNDVKEIVESDDWW